TALHKNKKLPTGGFFYTGFFVSVFFMWVICGLYPFWLKGCEGQETRAKRQSAGSKKMSAHWVKSWQIASLINFIRQ
ncbi:MAG: hypothetical protein ACRCYI_07095, partial [Plesiomonas shigelloides]